MSPAIEWLEEGFEITQEKIAQEVIETQAEYPEESIRVYPDHKTSWYTAQFHPIQYHPKASGFFSIKEDHEHGDCRM